MRGAVLAMLLAAVCGATTLAGVARAGPIEDGEAMLINREYTGAFALFMELASAGDPRAQFYVGSMYERGQGVPRDLNASAKWYRRSSDQGDDVGQFSLARMYHLGAGVPQALPEAAKLYGFAAGKGNPDAAYNMGLMYERGEGVLQDHVAAKWWFQKAADLRSTDAQAALNILDNKEAGKLPDYRPIPQRYVASKAAAAGESGAARPGAPDNKQQPIPWNIGPGGAAPPPPAATAPPVTPVPPAAPPAAEKGKARAPAPALVEPTAHTLESVAIAAWESNPTVMIWRAVQLALVNGDVKLDAAQIDAILTAAGMPDFFLRAGKYSKEAATMEIEREREARFAAERDKRTEYSLTGTPLRALTRVAVKLCDPLDLAVVWLLAGLARRSGRGRAPAA